MKRILVLALMTTMGSTIMYAADNNKARLQDRLDNATQVIKELAAAPDKGIPDEIAAAAKCVAIVPSLKKGAFVFGGQYGQGFASCRTSNGRWSAPAPIRMAGGSWGFQIGGSSSDIVMVAVNDKGMQDLLSSKFKIGADASASAGPVGRHAQAGTDWKLDAQLLTYSRSKGLFAGVSLDGTNVQQNDDDTSAYYGHVIPFRTILDGHTPVPASARAFVSTVTRYFNRAKANDAAEKK